MNLIYKPENNGKNIEEYDCHYLTGYTEEELISFTGADPKDSFKQLVRISGFYPTIVVHVMHKEYTVSRLIDFERAEIVNQLMQVHRKQTGLGTKLLTKQVNVAVATGFTRLSLFAAGNRDKLDKLNGYVTFAKLGFTMINEEIEKFRLLINAFGRPEHTVNELVATEDGAEWWIQNGYSWSGEFDLREGSINRKLLNAYLCR